MRRMTARFGRARPRAGELDRRLAAGADPIESDVLALRVGQLGSPTARARLARSLRAAVRLGDEYHASLGRLRIRRAEIRKNRELLLALAERVDDGDPVGVRGLAMASQLLDDPRSPLFSERAPRPLSVAAFEALVELDRGLRVASPLPP
jgi:hypothetical protein